MLQGQTMRPLQDRRRSLYRQAVGLNSRVAASCLRPALSPFECSCLAHMHSWFCDMQPRAEPAAQPLNTQAAALQVDGMSDDLLQACDNGEGGSAPVGPSSGIAARLEALRSEASVAPGGAAAAQPPSRSATSRRRSQSSAPHVHQSSAQSVRFMWSRCAFSASSTTSCSSGSSGMPSSERSLAALAEELFEEATFKAACHQSVHMRLQRTKDGATQESRIQELGGVQIGPHSFNLATLLLRV